MRWRFLRSRNGIETLEAAITAPIAILMTLAAVNLGMAVYGQQAVQAAATYGARMGSVAQECAACYAVTDARAAIEAAKIVENPQVEVLAPGGTAGSILRIRVSGQIPNFMGPLAAIFPGLPTGPFGVSAEATFRQEGW